MTSSPLNRHLPASLASESSRPARLVLVQAEDRSGVLQRVTNCLARRGFRLLSCTICQGPTSGLLSIWLRVGTGPQPYDQVTKQLAKLIDVVSVEDLTEQDPLQWVTALVEIRKVGDARDLELALDRPGVQVVRRLESSVLAAVSGPPEEVGESMRRLRQLPLVDWVVGRPLALAQHKTVPATANSKQTMSGS